jgi:hypothetical protein
MVSGGRGLVYCYREQTVTYAGFPATMYFHMRPRRAYWNWLLLLPALGLMFPGVYARNTPVLLGFPFFYWYQLGWIILTGLITGIVYLGTRNKSRV